MTAPATPPHRLAAMRGWSALWLVTLVFVVQLFAATQHDHESGATAQHCVACALHAQPHASPPPAAFSVAPGGWRLVQVLAPRLFVVPAAPAADYLLPPAHAPPASLLPY